MKLTISARPEPVTLDTEQTALIVVDMQNAFCKKGGLFDYLGHLDEKKAGPVISRNARVIDACRKKGIKIVFLRMGYRPDLSNAGGTESPNYHKELGLVAMREHPELKGRFLVRGSWDWQIIDDLTPRPEDVIVDKHRYGGFSNTELDTILRAAGIRYLLFTGVATNVCVESTLREAYFHEYFPILVGDGCGNIGPDFTRQATVWNVTNVFGWVTETQDLLEVLS